MKPSILVWLTVPVGAAFALSATSIHGWVAGVVVASALALAIPLSVKRFRHERNLVRTVWRALTTR
jgi:hypothetical protein